MLRKLTGLMALAVVAACSGRGGSEGPDEFSVLPTLPLTYPATNALPVPTPGGSNPTDPNPRADAIVALGGQPQGLSGGVPAADGALVAQAGRNGVTGDVRTVTAAEAARLRGRSRVTAGRARAGQVLDPYAELDRYRAAGVPVPSAPPAP